MIIATIFTIIPRIIPAIHMALNLRTDLSSLLYLFRPMIPKIKDGINAPTIPKIRERIANTGLGFGGSVACWISSYVGEIF